MADPQFYSATETFATELDGVPVVVHRNENVRAGHPLIEANPDKFKPLEVTTRWETVEQATAAPGEKRAAGRRHKPVGRTGIPSDPRGTSDNPDANKTKETH
jgi:hypothetical protein